MTVQILCNLLELLYNRVKDHSRITIVNEYFIDNNVRVQVLYNEECIASVNFNKISEQDEETYESHYSLEVLRNQFEAIGSKIVSMYITEPITNH